MKRTLILLFVAALALCACGTPKAPVKPTHEPGAQLPNPVVEYDSAVPLADFGYPIDAPARAESVHYSIISEWIAQVHFTLDGARYTYRAAKADEQDIAGVYETFDEEAAGYCVDGEAFSVTADIRTVSGGADGTLATWTHGDAQFSLYTADEVAMSVVEDLVWSLTEAWYAAQ